MAPEISTGLVKQVKLLWRSPTELRTLYLINFLNSYKYFSMALVLPLIASAEYGFTDTQAGGLYGLWGILITVWGFIASWMVDTFGVRSTAVFSTFSSVVARAVFTFCRSPTSLVVTVLILSPIGDGTFDPCFNVGLKKTTTEMTRPFAYALAYTVMNLGGAFSDNLTDYIRLAEFEMFGQPFSGLRCVLLSATLCMVLAFLLSLSLRDLSQVEAQRQAKAVRMTPPTRRRSPNGGGGTLSTPEMRRVLKRGGPRGGVSPASASAFAAVQSTLTPSPNQSRLPQDGGGGGVRLNVAHGKKAFESPRWIPSFAMSFRRNPDNGEEEEAQAERRAAASRGAATRGERQPLRPSPPPHGSSNPLRSSGSSGTLSTYQQQQHQQPTLALEVDEERRRRRESGGVDGTPSHEAVAHRPGGEGAAARGVKQGNDAGVQEEKKRLQQEGTLVGNPNFWRVVVFMTLTLFTSQQWRFEDLIMPKFCTRFFGDRAPFADIQSINFWGCVFAPPLISSWTSGQDDLAVMVPGLWIFSLAPLPLVFSNSLGAVAAWITLLTIGEVIWSPRSSSYAASMAPEGREGMFLMMCSWPVYLTKYPAGLMSGWLLSSFVPDCSECTNDLDEFCPFAPHSTSSSSQLQCASGTSGECKGALVHSATAPWSTPPHCAQTCTECPGWKGDGEALFLWIFCFSMVSPIAITILFSCLQRPYSDWSSSCGTPPPPAAALPPHSAEAPGGEHRYDAIRDAPSHPINDGAESGEDKGAPGWPGYSPYAQRNTGDSNFPEKANSLNF